LLKVIIASFARILWLDVKSLYFWLYRHIVKIDETIDNVCYSSSPFILVLLISLYSLAWRRVTLLKSKVNEEFKIYYLRRCDYNLVLIREARL
jgi:hypothetical protein